MNKVLVIAPHPDDETLGSGGTILKHKSKGDQINWLILTEISEEGGWEKKQVEKRQLEIEKVTNAYAFNSVHKLNFPATMLESIPMKELVGNISSVIEKVQPNVVYLNHHKDIHTDHQTGFKAVMSSMKNFRHPYIERILMYETLSETEFAASVTGSEFRPNVFSDITDYFEEKCKIMQIYASELMDPPYPRSLEAIEALAKFRGSRIGCVYAESFILLLETI